MEILHIEGSSLEWIFCISMVQNKGNPEFLDLVCVCVCEGNPEFLDLVCVRACV